VLLPAGQVGFTRGTGSTGLQFTGVSGDACIFTEYGAPAALRKAFTSLRVRRGVVAHSPTSSESASPFARECVRLATRPDRGATPRFSLIGKYACVTAKPRLTSGRGRRAARKRPRNRLAKLAIPQCENSHNMGMSDRLGKLATFYHREARKCSQARAYFSASVMQVAALEAALQSMCFVYPVDVKKTKVYQHKRFRKKRSKALEFSLYQLIDIAELAWFPPKRISWGGKRAALGGFAHEIRKLRNFIHSGVWGREQHGATKFTKRVYGVVFEVYDVAISWLIHRVHRSRRSRRSQG